MEDSHVLKAIEASLHSRGAFCKFLSANDSGETGGHQSGILVSKSARFMLFTERELKDNHILKNMCISNGRKIFQQRVALLGMKVKMSFVLRGLDEGFLC